MTAVYVIIAIFIFGFLIFIHEGGHYLFARLFKVTVIEFAIGMGPKIISKKSKKTGIAYSLRLLPIGGFVSMAGEDEESDDENAFCNKSVWKRMIITVAGAATNIIAGILVMSIFVATSAHLASTTVGKFTDNGEFSAATGIEVGDTITKVEGKRVYIYSQLYYEIARKGIEPIDITVERNGETITFEDVRFPTETIKGTLFGTTGFIPYEREKTVGNIVKEAFFQSVTTIKTIWESLYDLITGRYGIEAVSGPVGITEELVSAARSGARNLVYLAVVISMNVGFMNLLPIPALDGGRLLFEVIEAVIGKPVNRTVEGYIHLVGMILILILMALIIFKDIAGFFR